jgi:Outer membrane protein beta-barrel domain
MKKILPFTIIFILCISTIDTSAQIKLGITAGANVAVTKTNFFYNVENITKPTIGIVAQFKVAGLLFRPGVSYLQEGLKSFQAIRDQLTNGTAVLTELDNKLKMESIQIPLDLAIPIKAGKGKFLISFAPVITIGLKASTSNISTQTINDTTKLLNNSNKGLNFAGVNATFKRIDWGGKLGIGYEFKNGIQLNASYKAGLNNIATTGADYKKNNIAITATYFIFK